MLTAVLGQETMALPFNPRYEELMRVQADGSSPGSSNKRGDDSPPPPDLASHLSMASIFLYSGRNGESTSSTMVFDKNQIIK